ncbi:MAG: Gfo/Idh/MocA family oxidoreductase [Candidatus Omnitrophica bacterium]|nr:Gfo/Idh/MocA family oxidoreductase [Candidatus Omnitrophota bacterium]MBU4149586.1 Gfo/Idh/MocA family oxidoreductase [Candidatus Omnitrophota bacterium]
MKKLRVGVIGLGRLGSIHSQIYSRLKNVALSGICDTDKDRASSMGKALKTDWFTDYKRLLDKDIDAVSIVTPTVLHHKIAKFFLNNKVNCLIEKPITKTLREASELVRLARRKKLILQVGHVERFNSAIQAIERLLPRPRFIEVHRLGPFTPRVKDVGVVLDLMIHDIDIVLGLTKSKIRDIQAVGMKILTKHEDIANARIRFKNGTVCDLTASRVTDDTLRKIRLFQKDCYISLDYVSQEAIISSKIKNKIVSKKIDIKKERPLQKELSSFVDCVLNKHKPIVSGREAYNALSVAHRIIRKLNA